MKDQTFRAILAKNQIARMLRDGDYSGEQLIACLRDIENEIGTGNQPTIESIINDNKKWL